MYNIEAREIFSLLWSQKILPFDISMQKIALLVNYFSFSNYIYFKLFSLKHHIMSTLIRWFSVFVALSVGIEHVIDSRRYPYKLCKIMWRMTRSNTCNFSTDIVLYGLNWAHPIPSPASSAGCSSIACFINKYFVHDVTSVVALCWCLIAKPSCTLTVAVTYRFFPGVLDVSIYLTSSADKLDRKSFCSRFDVIF